MFLPPVLRPLAVTGSADPALLRLTEAPFSLVHGARGAYAAERLAGVLASWHRLESSVWLRVADSRAPGLGQALEAACGYRWPGAGLREAPEGAVLVLEVGRLGSATRRLLRDVRPVVVDRRLRLVVVAETRMPPALARFPGPGVDAALLAGESVGPAEDPWLRTRAGRRPAVLDDLRAASSLWSPDPVPAALRETSGLPDLLEQVTRRLLPSLTAEQLGALRVAVRTGYWHPRLGSPPVTTPELRPWLVPLEDGWGWLRPVWGPALRHALADGPAPARAGPAPAPVRPVPPRTHLEARLLGPLTLRVDGQEIGPLHGRLGPSVLRFLLARHRHEATRDEILEEFWPDVGPRTARNRLQVTISGLRRAFAEATGVNVVEYVEGRYRINPVLDVDVDVTAYERELTRAAAAAAHDDHRSAAAAYRRAVEMYRGDFAAEVPFEGWTVLPRESLRLRQIDALDRLATMDLRAGRIDDGITDALRMLELDPCREDAHRLLMRLHTGAGRPYLALRQYELCRRMLKGTLDVAPDAETQELYEAIRRSRPGTRPPR